MTTYARVKDGIVQEIVTPSPMMENLPIDKLYAPEIADAWVPIDGLAEKPAYGWTYDGGRFSPPPPIEDEPRHWAWVLRLRPDLADKGDR